MMFCKKKEPFKLTRSELHLITNFLWDRARSLKNKGTTDLTVEQVYNNMENAKSLYKLRDRLIGEFS